jgi:hypothetical protein
LGEKEPQPATTVQGRKELSPLKIEVFANYIVIGGGDPEQYEAIAHLIHDAVSRAPSVPSGNEEHKQNLEEKRRES